VEFKYSAIISIGWLILGVAYLIYMGLNEQNSKTLEECVQNNLDTNIKEEQNFKNNE